MKNPTTTNDEKLKTIYFKNIDFFRILFVVIIIMLHLFASKNYLYGIAPEVHIFNYFHYSKINADRCVDFFFIISGFFLAITAIKDLSIIVFIKKRIVRLYPAVLICLLIYYIFAMLGMGHFFVFENLLSAFMINGIGLIQSVGNSSQLWFVSALFWSSIFYFCIIKLTNIKYRNILIALISIFAYSLSLHYGHGHLRCHLDNIYHIFNFGLLRACGGLGIGYFLYQIFSYYQRLKPLSITKTIIVSIIEFALLVFLIKNLIFSMTSFANDLVYIISFCIIFCLFLANKGFISQSLNSNICTFLGKYSYTMYVMQYLGFDLLKKTLWQHNLAFVYNHPIINIFITLLSVFTVSFLTYHLLETPLKKLLNKLFFKA